MFVVSSPSDEIISRILVNGDAITGETELKHNDRLVFGSTQLWVFQNPKEKGIDSKKYPPITYEYAQEEIAAKAGIKVDTAGEQENVKIKRNLCTFLSSQTKRERVLCAEWAY